MTFDREQQTTNSTPLRTELERPVTHEAAPTTDQRITNPYPGIRGNVDERPVDWRPLIRARAPTDPVEKIDCVVKGPAPDAQPEDRPRFRKRGNEHHKDTDPDLINRVGDANDVARHRPWEAFRAAGQMVQDRHDAVGVEVNAFTHAERDQDLRAMLFMLPDKNWHGEIDNLAELQQVPTRGGPSVGSLFDDKNQLVLSKHDRSSVDQLGRSTKSGNRGAKTEKATGITIASDNAFLDAYGELKATVERASAASQAMTSAAKALEHHQAGEEAARGKGEIDRYRQEIAEIVEVVEIATAHVTMVAQFATGNVGDGIEQLGTIAVKLLSHLNDSKIEHVQKRVDRAVATMAATRGEQVVADVAKASHELNAAILLVPGKNAALRRAMTERRQAYNELGGAAGSELDCPQASRARISGMLAAIPIAELVAARAGTIRQRCEQVPAYTEEAGRGFGMARHDKQPEAIDFMQGVDELFYCELYYKHLESVWAQRVTQLNAIKQAIVGSRPGD